MFKQINVALHNILDLITQRKIFFVKPFTFSKGLKKYYSSPIPSILPKDLILYEQKFYKLEVSIRKNLVSVHQL